MPESARMWVEVVFNVTYLIVVWTLVAMMARRLPSVAPADRPVAVRFTWAFALLALGDTGHVGFRVLAYALGGLAAHPAAGRPGRALHRLHRHDLLHVDAGHLAAALQKAVGDLRRGAVGAGVVRLVVMAFPQNQWGQIVAPYDWSLLRNALLVVQGLGVMFLILRDAIRAGDTPFKWIGVMIAFSYAFYAPVILWSAQVPMLGMLMIPKTCAYLAVAIIGYRAIFQRKTNAQPRPIPQAA